MSIYQSTKVMPYVYKLTHKETDQFYIGYRGGVAQKTPSHNDILSYKSSSEIVKNIGFEHFDILIIAEFFKIEDAYLFEQELIFNEFKSDKILNKVCHHGKKYFKRKVGSMNKRKREAIDKIDKSKVNEMFNNHLSVKCIAEALNVHINHIRHIIKYDLCKSKEDIEENRKKAITLSFKNKNEKLAKVVNNIIDQNYVSELIDLGYSSSMIRKEFKIKGWLYSVWYNSQDISLLNRIKVNGNKHSGRVAIEKSIQRIKDFRESVDIHKVFILIEKKVLIKDILKTLIKTPNATNILKDMFVESGYNLECVNKMIIKNSREYSTSKRKCFK